MENNVGIVGSKTAVSPDEDSPQYFEDKDFISAPFMACGVEY